MNIRWAVSISLLSRKGVLIAAHHYSQPRPAIPQKPPHSHFALVQSPDFRYFFAVNSKAVSISVNPCPKMLVLVRENPSLIICENPRHPWFPSCQPRPLRLLGIFLDGQPPAEYNIYQTNRIRILNGTQTDRF